MKNIVFIGLPGCGKTTVSKKVAARLGRPWFDSDSEIEAQEGMRIAELFDAKGEAYFREKETECIGRLMRMQGIVLAVGGGAVLANAGLIAPNATVIYLQRSIPGILSTLKAGTRPLLRDTDRLAALYEQRRALYEKLADYTIINEGKIQETVKKVMEALS